MIRYTCTQAQIEKAVDAIDGKWRGKAKTQTQELLKLGAFKDGKVGWSDVKAAYMALQHHKCCYCEAPVYTKERGTYDLDVEHFRPKNAVVAWPRTGAGAYKFPTGGPGGAYFWLALEPTNYAVSCKECNSRYKSNFFPVAGTRGSVGTMPPALKNEQAFLVYPLGNWDADPEDLITFDATLAIPKSKKPAERQRAELIIDFFDLNGRDSLQIERAQFIMLFGQFLRREIEGKASVAEKRLVKAMDLPSAPHASCLRSFKRTWKAKPSRGRDILDDCTAMYLASLGDAMTLPA